MSPIGNDTEDFEEVDWQLECSEIRQRGARLLASAQWADCSFLLGPHRAPARAHKLILAMTSPVFKAMFYGPLAEGSATIPVPDIQPDIFGKLLQYIYTDNIELDSYTIAIQLYDAAQKYKLKHLLKECISFISSNMTPQNACHIYEFANFIENKMLQDKSLKVIKKDTKLVLLDRSFEDLHIGTVVKIFSLDDINIDSELDLLAAAERYFMAKKKLACLNTDERARSEATFRFTVQNIKNLNGLFFSPRCYIHGLPWQIQVRLYGNAQKGKKLKVYIICNDESKSNIWSCKASSSLKIIPHQPSKEEFCTEVHECLYRNDVCADWTQYISDILDPNEGFIKDDAITLEAHVAAEEPEGLSRDSKKQTTEFEIDDVAVLTVLNEIRFLTLTGKMLAEYVPKMALLTDEDMLALLMNISSKETRKPMRFGFSTCRERSSGNCIRLCYFHGIKKAYVLSRDTDYRMPISLRLDKVSVKRISLKRKQKKLQTVAKRVRFE